MKKVFDFILRVVTYVPAPFMAALTAPFRAWSRSIMYNAVLQKGWYLKRLKERDYKTVDVEHWHLRGWTSQRHGGFIQYRKVNWLQIIVAFSLWMWQDDDSNEDTTDAGYCNSISIGGSGWRANGVDRSKGILNFLYGKLLPKYNEGDVQFGNTFDLGDIRAKAPYYNFWANWVWTRRNRAMNMKYFLFDY